MVPFLGFLKTQIVKENVKIKTEDQMLPRPRTQKEIDEIDAALTESEGKVLTMNSSLELLNKRFSSLTELKHVLKETAAFFEEVKVMEN